ncbi:MAG: hypothetical protein WA666_13165 [Nitrospirota bacterium]
MESDKKTLLVFSLASIAVTAIYYGRFLHNFFIFDDFKYIENLFEGPVAVFFGYHSLRAVSNSSWWPLYAISGFDPFIFNLFGLVLQSVNAIVLYLCLLKLFKDKGYAVLGGAFFLLNAVGCDAIFWKAANSGLISLFFYLLTLYAYVSYRQKGSKSYRALSILFFLVAMFSKEEAASLPFIVILIELVFFGGLSEKKAVLRRAAPFIAIVLFYMVMNKVMFNYILHTYIELSKFFQPRPLYALFAGWTVFFLPPQGHLKMSNPAIYLTPLGIILSFFWVKDKRALYFGYGWIFLSFLPQSLTSLGQFEPRYIFNSISRYLYITSIGSSVIFAAVILRFREKFSAKVYYPVAVAAVSLFALLNYGQVQTRGNEWRDQAAPMIPFLASVKDKMPDFPPNSYVFVIEPPVGRSYVQQALRAFYRRADISWIYSTGYTRKPGENAFLISCRWSDDGKVNSDIVPIKGFEPTGVGCARPVF